MSLIREIGTPTSISPTELRPEIVRLYKRIGRTNGHESPRLVERLDDLINEAAAADQETIAEALAALEIALIDMGADCKHPSRGEKLIIGAVRVLRNLVCLVAFASTLLTPCISGIGVIASRFSDLV